MAAATRGRKMTLLQNFKARRQEKALGQAAARIFNDVHQHVRGRWFYVEAEVPDSAASRFELITLYLSTINFRLAEFRQDERAKALSRLLVEHFFDQLDIMFREMGVGDMGVAKKVRALAGQYFERYARLAERYEAAQAQAGSSQLAGYILDAIYAGQKQSAAKAAMIEADLAAFAAALQEHSLKELIASGPRFPEPPKDAKS